MDEQGSTGAIPAQQSAEEPSLASTDALLGPVAEATSVIVGGGSSGQEEGAAAEQPTLLYEEPQTQTAQMEGNEPFDTFQTQPQGSQAEYKSVSQVPEQSQPPPAVAEETKHKQSSWNIFAPLLEKARLAIHLRKEKKLARIMALFEKHPVVTNDDVEKLLHVSDATAARYLSELEREGKVKQGGKEGRGVVYIKA